LEDSSTRATAGIFGFSKSVGGSGGMVGLTLIETIQVAHVRNWHHVARGAEETYHNVVDFCATINADSMSLPRMLSVDYTQQINEALC
jgi:hypothetical protein